ncbi:hypothetical protein ACOMHN_055791 [Nucella lapillus]
MAENDLESFVAPYVRKSQCFTIQHKYPRTLHNVDYLDWSSDPMRPDLNHYHNPRRSTEHPLPFLKRFRPLPPPWSPSLDPMTKTLRKFDDPIPHPLATVKRESYQNPASYVHLKYPQNFERFGYTPRDCAAGIVPLAMPTPPPWSEDCLFDQQQQKLLHQE